MAVRDRRAEFRRRDVRAKAAGFRSYGEQRRVLARNPGLRAAIEIAETSTGKVMRKEARAAFARHWFRDNAFDPSPGQPTTGTGFDPTPDQWRYFVRYVIDRYGLDPGVAFPLIGSPRRKRGR